MEDLPTLAVLIAASVRGLQRSHYSVDQMEGAIGSAFGVDTQLIHDGTYFAAETEGKVIAGCGGWSRRRTLYGSDHVAGKDDALLDPATEPAKIRAFFIHPDWARQGIGTGILQACEQAAMDAGFTRLELAATLTGEPLFRARGFTETGRFDVPLPNGIMLPVVRMTKSIFTR